MRVALICEVYLPKIDGVVTRTVNLINELISRGDEVIVICPQCEGDRYSAVPVIEFPSFPFLSYPDYRIGLPNHELIHAIKRFSPDVLHFVNPFAFGFRCFDTLERSGFLAPSVFSFHTVYGDFVKSYKGLRFLGPVLWWLSREYHNAADLNLTVSSAMLDELSERGFQRMQLWKPAVDSERFSPSHYSVEMRRKLTTGHPESPLLITVSRLAPEKNVVFLADVMRRLPQARLAIVGDGPQRKELEAKFMGLNTSFNGFLAGQELAQAYASADAFIYASETETMGNVVLEAMASRLPVIAPRARGITSLVTHAVSGFLYPPGDVSEAQKGCETLVNNRRLRTAMGEEGRLFAVSHSWKQAVEGVRQVYQQAIKENRNAPMRDTSRRIASAMSSAMVTGFRTSYLALRGLNAVSPRRWRKISRDTFHTAEWASLPAESSSSEVSACHSTNLTN